MEDNSNCIQPGNQWWVKDGWCIEYVCNIRRNKKAVGIAVCGLIIPFLFFALNIILPEQGYGTAWFVISLFFPSPCNVDYSILRFTAIDGINLPRFACFVTFLAVFTKSVNFANRVKYKQIRAFYEGKTWFRYFFVRHGSILKEAGAEFMVCFGP